MSCIPSGWPWHYGERGLRRMNRVQWGGESKTVLIFDYRLHGRLTAMRRNGYIYQTNKDAIVLVGNVQAVIVFLIPDQRCMELKVML
jgi:hypothetical protein